MPTRTFGIQLRGKIKRREHSRAYTYRRENEGSLSLKMLESIHNIDAIGYQMETVFITDRVE